ncbi:DUF4330 domain-containing protein [Oxynema aestuarii]|jgi:hypothetical protein|uniref:DUF4330 domain-containing protein n=1 Tax=Oxynema aestuarii AP17 TaxID=2064643 RepID=A0A6H1TVK5_9CYAN|nr:DUF4330 domain-containing protein [Oxynema aestuarii]QIZ69970.1 DUF4330 domain-containing protein [Oxynema aestuarii AP17]RMH77201.1 MAG: DUF4330 domain-containing protein [Cyanobacteria bacterium J007]
MNILDSKGRLFGKISVLDLGAALVIVFVIIGIFFFPGQTGSVAQVGVTTKPVEVDLIVRGLSVRDPQALLEEFREKGKTNIIIRNQPHGAVDVKSIELLTKTLAIPQPDGSVKALPDPRQEESFSSNLMITLGGRAQITENGPVLGNNKLKIGTPVELEGLTYNFNASVIDVRIK